MPNARVRTFSFLGPGTIAFTVSDSFREKRHQKSDTAGTRTSVAHPLLSSHREHATLRCHDVQRAPRLCVPRTTYTDSHLRARSPRIPILDQAASSRALIATGLHLEIHGLSPGRPWTRPSDTHRSAPHHPDRPRGEIRAREVRAPETQACRRATQADPVWPRRPPDATAGGVGARCVTLIPAAAAAASARGPPAAWRCAYVPPRTSRYRCSRAVRCGEVSP